MHFVTFTTGNYTDMTKNLLINFEKILVPSGHCLILICMDELATNNLSMYKGIEWVIFQSRHVITGDVGIFNTPSYNNLMNFKPILVRELLDTYDELYWVDSDIVFYADPLPYVRANLTFQQDHPTEEAGRLCAGNFYVKKNQESLDFFATWIEAVHQNPDKHDQESLNKMVMERYGNYTNIPGVHVFPPEKFQRGYDAIKLKWWRRDDKVCIHVNYIEGFDAKKDALKWIQSWYIF
jgi:hypothetical protein